MHSWIRGLRLAGIVSLALPFAHQAEASQAYQGIYTIIDPYNQPQINLLHTASQTACTGTNANAKSPFCSATNGILLRVGWCDFQLYHQTNSKGKALPSCHYGVQYSNGVGSKGQQFAPNEVQSPCAGTYDVCSGQTQSVLGNALSMISQINTQRSAAHLPPLNLSIGLEAGSWTPQSVFDTSGFIDVPHTNAAGTNAATMQCLRLPLPWQPSYINAYNAAFDQFVAYVASRFPQGANVSIIKISGNNSNDLELDMPGSAVAVSAPADPGPAGPGGLVTCPSVPGATAWLAAYNQTPFGNDTFAQAMEHSLGAIVGHSYATAINDGFGNALLSIPTTGGEAYPNIGCGLSGAAQCTVNASQGNWTLYYMNMFVDDLFNGGIAQNAARAAYQAVRNDTFSLTPVQLAVNWTGLSPTPITPSQQIGCVLNNTNPAQASTTWLAGSQVQMMGTGTTIGWQTQALSSGQCSTGDYAKTLANGINNGGMFLEVQSDAAFANLNTCGPALSAALTQILAASPPATCAY